ncbi:hypothetical protein D3C72_2257970 [compost metagenome]
MVEGAQHAAAEEDDGGDEDRRGGHGGADQPHPHQQRRDDSGGEDLKHPLDPEVDDPPAPVLHDRDMGLLAPHQAGPEQQTDRHGGDGHQQDQGHAALAPQQGPQAAKYQQHP